MTPLMAIRIFGELPGAFGRGRGFIAASLLYRHRCATKAFPRKTSGPRSTGRQRGSRVAYFWVTSFGKKLSAAARQSFEQSGLRKMRENISHTRRLGGTCRSLPLLTLVCGVA